MLWYGAKLQAASVAQMTARKQKPTGAEVIVDHIGSRSVFFVGASE